MRVSALEGHRLWAPVYDAAFNPLLALERRSMRELVKPPRAGYTIDVACGTGQALLHLRQSGSEVFGVDACQEMLDEAAKCAPLRGRVINGKAECLPFPSGLASLILCSMALGYFDDLPQVFAEFARISAPGAFIAFSDVHPDALAAGWSRSFRAGDLHVVLDHHSRSLKEIEAAASSAGLRPYSSKPLYFGEAEYPVFQSAGKAGLFARLQLIPALFLGLWRKPC